MLFYAVFSVYSTMKPSVLLLLYTLFWNCLFAQDSEVWNYFNNYDTTLSGYKDQNGNIRIEPKFVRSPIKFDLIIAVTEDVHGDYQSYYLTKSGRIVGRDSVHYYDNGQDCESEGFIRFRDYKTDKAGLFNRNGDVAIPAEYNDISRVENGMIIALKGAVKKMWEGGEHYSWEGGKEQLIDTNNHVLIDNFDSKHHFNFYSLVITTSPHQDNGRISLLGEDGRHYSFVDFEKEFERWFKDDFLFTLNRQNLIKNAMDSITWWSGEEWLKSSREQFIVNNYPVLETGLFEVLKPKTDYFISSDGLNRFMFEGPEFEKFFDNCGDPKTGRYPVLEVIVTHKKRKDISQNHYEFLRTDNGYKLISVSVRDQNLK